MYSMRQDARFYIYFLFYFFFLQKMNFPINYTIQVHYEEVFRLRNISRLVSLYPTDTVPN